MTKIISILRRVKEAIVRVRVSTIGMILFLLIGTFFWISVRDIPNDGSVPVPGVSQTYQTPPPETPTTEEYTPIPRTTESDIPRRSTTSTIPTSPSEAPWEGNNQFAPNDNQYPGYGGEGNGQSGENDPYPTPSTTDPGRPSPSSEKPSTPSTTTQNPVNPFQQWWENLGIAK